MPDPVSEHPQAPPQGVTLTPEQFATFQRGQLLLQKLSQGTTKRQFERLVKEIVPEVETTEDIAAEAAQPYIEKLEAATSRFENYVNSREEAEKARVDAQAAADLSSTFANMRREGLTEEGENEVRRYMVERNIPDPWAALALWEKNNPPPPQQVAAWEPDSWNYTTRAVGRDVDELFKDSDRWADQEASNVLAELRRAQPV